MELFSSIGETWQTWAVDPLSEALTLIRDGVGSYAIAIILFTIAIRTLMIPLTVKQIRSQRRMQVLQPEMAEIRRKFRNDRQAQSQATMKLYKEHGVSPLSGCLPIFVQLPILLALYGGILTLSGQGLLNEQFLWFNLAREDSTIPVLGESSPTAPTDVHLATTFPITPLESQLAAEFADNGAQEPRVGVNLPAPHQTLGAVRHLLQHLVEVQFLVDTEAGLTQRERRSLIGR